jgi:hypothetical protein
VLKANKSAFKELFDKFPPQNLALPVLSNRFKPETPPPTPEQKSILPSARKRVPQYPPIHDHPPQSRLTPPITPSPSPQEKIMLKLVVKKPVVEEKYLDYIKVKRRSKRLAQLGV